jgi:lysophospholipase L1-like esterase
VFRSAIEDLCRTAQSNGVKTVLLFVPTLDELASTNQSRVLATKLTVSAKLGVPLLDLTQELSGGGKALYLEADPVHLNAAGNAIVARRLFEGMTNRLTQ